MSEVRKRKRSTAATEKRTSVSKLPTSALQNWHRKKKEPERKTKMHEILGEYGEIQDEASESKHALQFVL